MVTTQQCCKNVSYLVRRRNMRNNDNPGINVFLNKMTINFNVFCSFMKNKISSNMKNYLVVAMQRQVGEEQSICKSRRRLQSQISSRVVEVIPLYSASVEEQETFTCFLDFQKMRELSRNTMQPEVERQVVGQLAQLESQSVRCQLQCAGTRNEQTLARR